MGERCVSTSQPPTTLPAPTFETASSTTLASAATVVPSPATTIAVAPTSAAIAIADDATSGAAYPRDSSRHAQRSICEGKSFKRLGGRWRARSTV